MHGHLNVKLCGHVFKASMTPSVLTKLYGFKSKWLLSHDTTPILTQFGPSETRREKTLDLFCTIRART